MINPELYQRTVDILVKAYFEDTLEHTNCRACAVGNIVAANMGIDLGRNYEIIFNRNDILPKNFIPHNPEYDSGMWFHCIFDRRVHEEKMTHEIIKQVEATGYTAKELSEIEYNFENAPYGNSEDEWMFNGLMAVIDVLDEIHQNTDKEVTEVSKKRFEKVN